MQKMPADNERFGARGDSNAAEKLVQISDIIYGKVIIFKIRKYAGRN